jgi:hypothetical protein
VKNPPNLIGLDEAWLHDRPGESGVCVRST